tara:strand:- start:204 stop:506 length:303 start_codon:yes stop_codon:yes gene_type:complete
MELKTEQEVIDLVGRETTLKFEFMSDNLMTYSTLVPFIKDEELKRYKVSLFYEDLQDVFAYDNLIGFLSDFQIFELIEENECCKGKGIVLYQNKYEGNEN